MKLQKYHLSFLILIPILWFFVSLIFEKQNTKHQNQKAELNISKSISSLIQSKTNYGLQLLKSENFKNDILNRNIKGNSIQNLVDHGFLILVTKDKMPFFWTSNIQAFDTSIFGLKDQVDFHYNNGITILVLGEKYQQFNIKILYVLANENNNTSLKDDNPLSQYQNIEYEINNLEDKGSIVMGNNNSPWFKFHLFSIGEYSKWWLFLDIIFLILFLGFLFIFIISNQKSTHIIWLKILIIITLRILLFNQYFFKSIFELELFDPQIYASSYYLPSLGDLILHIIFGSFILLLLHQLIQKIKQIFQLSNVKSYLFLSLFLICNLFMFDMVFTIIKDLVIDSNISFYFADIPKLDLYSFIGTAAMGVMLIVVFYFFYQCFMKLNFKSISLKIWLLSSICSIIFFLLFQYFNGNRFFLQLMMIIIFNAILVLFYFYNFKKPIYYFSLILITFSCFCAFTINHYNKIHELEYLKLYINKILTNKDIESENLFASIEKELIREFITPEDFQTFFNNQAEYEKRIKNLFFSGYLDKYELKIISFDSSGANLNPEYRINFQTLDYIYRFESYSTISNHFYQIKGFNKIRGFIAKFETCDVSNSYGTVFLLLQPKIIQSSHSYPEILESKKEKQIFDFKEYSYATYLNRKLISQKGDFPYKLLLENDKKQESSFYNYNGFKHYKENASADLTIIISKKQDYFVKSFALFSFIFIFFVLISACFYGIYMLFYAIPELFLQYQSTHKIQLQKKSNTIARFPFLNFRQRLLSSRIQLVMVGLVFVGLAISVFFTIQYVQFNYNQRQQEQLFTKLKEILNQLENEPDLQKRIKSNNRIKALVNQLSDANRIDLNLFDNNGLLITSTQPNIFNQNILAPIMQPNALYRLRTENSSQLLINEHILGLNYLSGYVPLFDDENNVLGYLNLPYFTEKSELEKEISSFLVSLINIYFLLLLGAVLGAYFISQRITKPLLLIKDKIGKTSISSKNEIIEWKQQDEIGQLVKQYNKMVLELEESAKKLSETEREGAWKEMARQVAHEIKNPLTPMKLNIQHLQRAWNGNTEKLNDTFERVTKVLIEQIDSLSRLATEFSSFAKMPTDNFESCDLKQIIESVIALFEKTDDIDFQLTLDEPSYIIFADKEQIGRVFNNIIKNAIQSIPDDRKGKIKVEVFTNENSYITRITDNGKGIESQIIPKIFVPNFSTKTSGMGLGLAIAKKIVESTNGSIHFETTLNVGTVFEIKLPIYTKV